MHFSREANPGMEARILNQRPHVVRKRCTRLQLNEHGFAGPACNGLTQAPGAGAGCRNKRVSALSHRRQGAMSSAEMSENEIV